uniref:Coiled-coil domain-containing protein 138 n=1 Tax=Neogobius melanostomus TaxID=47308 RepID=A0A8C6SD71_9GOBI
MATAKKKSMADNHGGRKQQLSRKEDSTYGISDEVLQKLIMAHRYAGKELKGHSKVLHGLFKGIILTPPDPSDNDEEGVEDHITHPRSDSPLFFTETDVTLPSCLNGSLGSRETDREMDRARHPSHFCSSSASGAAEILKKMETVYDQLKTEQQKQLQWEQELQEREKTLKQQEEALQKLVDLEGMLHSKMLSAEEKHKQEVHQLQFLLREKTKENKRLKSSFETLKDLNDNMKKQINDLREQNKKLENQSRRVQARLENLQRKYELGVSLRGCQKMNVKSLESVKPPKKDIIIPSCKNINKGAPTEKLLSLLLDWLHDGQWNSSTKAPTVKDVGHCLPPEILLNERCLKALPLIADQLALTPLSELVLVRGLLRLVHSALRHLDNSAQHVVLSATVRRIGEEVSKPRSHLQFDPAEEPGPCRKRALYQSPCPESRILSVLIILRTVSQADALAQALDSLRSDLTHEENRGLLLHYGGVSELLSVLRTGRGGLQAPIIDALMQLTQQSSYLKSFMEACSCDEFFHTASQVLKSPHLELSLWKRCPFFSRNSPQSERIGITSSPPLSISRSRTSSADTVPRTPFSASTSRPSSIICSNALGSN